MSNSDEEDNAWVKYFSKSKQKSFYYNKLTKEKKWSLPPCKRSKDPIKESVIRAMKVGGSMLQRNGKAIVFKPWKHQIEAVYNVLKSMATEKQNYLVQHSTGSGKSMTIACLAHQLIEFYVPTVIVLVDRIQLDEQLGDTLQHFLNRNGSPILYRTTSVQHLARILSQSYDSSRQVVLTTIQKFAILMEDPVMRSRICQSTSGSHVKCAIIVDEAHRRHGHDNRTALDAFLGTALNAPNCTYIGFSATPSDKSVNLFTSKHIYSMKEAIKNGHVLNVLEHYTCIRLDIETTIPSQIRDKLDTDIRIVMDYASTLNRILEYKVEIMVSDFNKRKLEFKDAKCMVIARSRADVVRYYQKLKMHSHSVYCAFSSEVIHHEVTFTERNINSIAIEKADFIVACDKLDTGFNEPKLAALYLDRPVHGSKVMQLFSRINRTTVGKTKVYVIDFANHPFRIAYDFAQYWNRLTIERRFKNTISVHTQQLYTGACILLEILPELKENNPVQLKGKLASVERDVYKQIVDTIRWYHAAAQACNQYHSCVTKSSVQMLLDIIGSFSTVDSEFSTMVKKRISARIVSKNTVFCGKLNPETNCVIKRQFLQNFSKESIVSTLNSSADLIDMMEMVLYLEAKNILLNPSDIHINVLKLSGNCEMSKRILRVVSPYGAI